MPPPPSCTPGTVERCECPVGGGTAVCGDDGASLSPCLCPIERAVLKPDVEVLGEKSAGAVLEGDTLKLGVAGNEVLRDLAPGTVVVSFEGAGFLRRVVDVTEVGDRFEVATEPAGLVDAFEELEVSFSGQVDPTAYLSKADRDLLRSPRLDVPIDGFTVAFGGSGSGFSGEAAFSIDEPSHFSIDLGIDFHLKLRPALEPVEALEELRAEVDVSAGILLVSTASVSGSLTYEESIDIIKEIQKAAGQPLAQGIVIPLGNGFSAFIDMNFTCGVGVSGAVSITTEIEAGLDFYAGVRWNDDTNTFSKISPQADPYFSAEVTDFGYDAEAIIYCALQPKAGITFLSVADAFFQAGPQADVTLGVDNESYHIGVGAEINGTLGADVTLEIGQLELNLLSAEYQLFSFGLQNLEGGYELFGIDFAICGDGWRHLEEECDVGLNLLVPGAEHCHLPPGDDACTCMTGYNPAPLMGASSYYGIGRNRCINACGNGVVDEGEVCDDGFLSGTACGRCSTDCGRVLGAHDGVVDAPCGEACDDGNNENCDACPNHRLWVNGGCGDGIVFAACGEACDDGNTENGDACSSTCRTSQFCGDGIVGTNNPFSVEECDDGNDDDCDGCTNQCKTVTNLTCGDSVVCGDEYCDLGGFNTNWCDADCTEAACGDGFVNSNRYEECDDGGPSATCTTFCKLSFCGDGVVNALAGEQCDTGGDSYACDADCTLRECGDGYLNAVEACDDGDTDDCTPGCNASCTGEAVANVCGDGVARCGEACDDGGANGAYGACLADCAGPGPACGDMIVQPEHGEGCDDGDTDSGDGCRGDCSGFEVCGDGVNDVNEACDDGYTAPCVGPCDETCSALYPARTLDGTLTACEQCEDSTPSGVDLGCSPAAPNCNGGQACSTDICGDGVVGPTEVCEPAMVCTDQVTPCTLPTGAECPAGHECIPEYPLEGVCLSTCQGVQTCGNDVVEGSETCDDGNTIDGDGCSSSCFN